MKSYFNAILALTTGLIFIRIKIGLPQFYKGLTAFEQTWVKLAQLGH